jgi:hypothetical protein
MYLPKQASAGCSFFEKFVFSHRTIKEKLDLFARSKEDLTA